MTALNWKEILFHDELLGHSPEINQIRKSLPNIGKSEQHVTVIGEPGTEKLLLAKLLFENSRRTDAPVILTEAARLNAAYEKELWNQISEQHIQEKKLVGTLILQDLEHLSPESQTKIYQLARKGYLTRTSSDTAVETDLRIISCTTPAIRQHTEKTQFASELFLSLSELTVKLPALTERKQDIPLLFDFFLNKICLDLNLPIPPVNFEIFNQMMKHHWQGNIKELENVVRSLVLSSPEGELLPEVLPFFNVKQNFNRLELESLGLAVAKVEKELIEKALRKFAGNQSRAAKILGISEPNMRFKMKKFGIKKEDFILGTE